MAARIGARLVALAAGLTAALAGTVSCGADASDPGHGVSAAPAVARTPASSADLMTHRLSLSTRNPTVTHLALGSRYLAYTQARSGAAQDFPNEVVAVDLASHRSSVVGRTAWSKGQSDWVVTSGDWVFWTDQNIAGADDPTGLRWTIRGADLRTGKKVELARNHFDSPVPLPVAGAGRVLWAQQKQPGSASNVLQEFVIHTGRTKQLATLPAAQQPEQLAVGRAGSYYDAMTAGGGKSDVWRVPLAGGLPRRVTSTGHARGVAADPFATVVAWSDGATTSDPTSFVVAEGDRPHRTVRSGVEYDLHVGTGFASYITQKAALRVVPLRSRGSVQVATDVVIPCRTAVAANRIAYCTQNPANGRITLRVDEIGS